MNGMKMTYDKKANAAYIYFREKGKSRKTIPVNDDIIVDFGSRGDVMGVEVLNARSHISRNDLRKAVLHKVDIPMVELI
jgi:uncharacterized protein YuzE